jgi:hypothetical protein
MKILLTILGFIGLFFGINAGIDVLPVSGIPAYLIALVTLFAGAAVLFRAVDYIIKDNKPAELNGEEVKAFFTSKIFWLAALLFASQVIEGVFGIAIDEETRNTIVELDWNNVGAAAISIVIMAIRKYDILKLLF